LPRWASSPLSPTAPLPVGGWAARALGAVRVFFSASPSAEPAAGAACFDAPGVGIAMSIGVTAPNFVSGASKSASLPTTRIAMSPLRMCFFAAAETCSAVTVSTAFWYLSRKSLG